MRKVNGCPKNIDLRNNFRDFFIRKEKSITDFFFLFYIFHESILKNFIKWSIYKRHLFIRLLKYSFIMLLR